MVLPTNCKWLVVNVETAAYLHRILSMQYGYEPYTPRPVGKWVGRNNFLLLHVVTFSKPKT